MTRSPTTRTATPATGPGSMRLAPRDGEVIDRKRDIEFGWNGTPYPAHPGDTIVSALAASGERVFSRSYKYHRPRGLLTADYLDPGAMVQVGDEPNVRGAHRPVAHGMQVRSQNTWPSLRFDVKAVNGLAGRFLAAGFYYKTFIKPERLWPAYEKVLRTFVHAGQVPPDAAHGYYDKRYAHPDVVVAGGGPAGMAAAVAAARAGARVMLVEEEHQLGGHLRWGGPGGLAARRELAAQVAAEPGIEVLTDSVVAGRFDDNWVAIVQRNLPHVVERLIKARAKTLVVAAGLIERPYVFAGNDLPGVMLSTAARRLINLYGVRPGHRAVVLSANDAGDAAAADLAGAGVDVAAVVDARRGERIVRAHGRSGLRAVELPGGRRVDCDLLVTAVGWTAPTSLLNQSGDHPVYDPRAARFRPDPGRMPDNVLAAGGIVGDGSTAELAEHASAVGQEAARRAAAVGRSRAAVPTALPDPVTAVDTDPVPVPELPVVDHPELFTNGTGGFVDFSEDVSAKDLLTAVEEGYDSVELAKRYTTATMGPAQGKLETVNTVAILAAATGRTIGETGTTTWRPMYAPVTLGALAGRMFEPVRYSPVQGWHERHGAAPMVAGQWIRPEHYGDPDAEVRAVRSRVGIIDVTPIGKLDLRGPDVAKLLNLLYVNKWSKLGVGKVRYGVMCAEDGVVLDDGVTGRLGEDHYLMSTTSSGAATVWEWAENWLQTAHPEWRVHLTPVTTAYTSINIAGPHSPELLARLAEDVDLSAAAFGYMQVRTATVAGVADCVLWRIGFTGELSYEVHVPAAYGLHVWERLIEVGQDLGVRPFGVEAQRILRLEKGHFIVGQDTDGLTQGFGAGIDNLIKLDKDDLVGKPELTWQSRRRDYLRLVGLQPLDAQVVPPEASQLLGRDGAIAGRITSSRRSPTLGRSICLGQLEPDLAVPGTRVTVRLPDGRDITAEVTAHVHLDPAGERQHADHPHPGPVAPAPNAPIARSPVTAPSPHVRSGWEVSARASTAALTLTDQTPLAKVLVRAPFDGATHEALEVDFGRTTRTDIAGIGKVLLVGSGPGEWLALADPGTGPALREHLETTTATAGEFTSVIDLTHGRALIRIHGRAAPQVLAKVCSIDLHESVTPNGAAFRTSVATLVTDVVRDDDPNEPSYLLHCERSSGQYLFDALLDAGAEFGIDVAGFDTTGIEDTGLVITSTS